MKKYLLSFCILLIAGTLTQAQTIAEIQGPGDASPYVDQQVNTSGIVTAVHSLGYFIQDGVAIRSGIYVYDDTQSPAVGDMINISASVAEFFNLTELVDVTALEIVSSGNPLPIPLDLTTGALGNEDYEGMLVKLTKANCSSTDLGFGEWELNDGSGPARVDDLIFLYSPMLNTEYSVTGPMTYTFDNYKIIPRSEDDIIIELPLYFTEAPVESDITTTGFTVSWQTNVAANTRLDYGLTPALELGTLVAMGGNTIEHQIILENLSPGTPYYIKAYSILGNDQTPSQTLVMSTVSNSSGDIKVYFNHPVDHTVATNQLAVYTDNIVDTIISYIERAEQTLDITMYEIENEEIVAAVNAAADRGINIRYISDDEGTNAVLDNLNGTIPLVKGNANGIMHDKFMIVDRESVDRCWVMTGSMNHTVNNLGWDYNNIICIQDQSLANAYYLEFNEMWGSDNMIPEPVNAKFGPDKSNNTPHRFVIGNRPVELYFSPSDGTQTHIKEVVDAAQNEVAFAILVFTENSLGTAVKEAHDRNVKVEGIIDYVEFNGSEYDYLLNNDIDVIDYQNADGSQWPEGPTLHHKYAIFDYQTGTDPVLITGSHNWTASANSFHDENTLIIHDATLANLYYQEFSARFNGLTDATQEVLLRPLQVSPNPSNGLLFVAVPEKGLLQLFDNKGQVLETKPVDAGQLQLSLNELPSGLYYLKIGGYLAKVMIKR